MSDSIKPFSESFSSGERLFFRPVASIVPRESIAGQTLTAVIAIMAFLACLTIGSVMAVNDSVSSWRSDVSREMTIQVRPWEDRDLDDDIRQARELVSSFEGISQVRILGSPDLLSLLEPWLGSGFDLEALPLPGLLAVTVSPDVEPDIEAIRSALEERIPSASLDDHRQWLFQLSAMASAVTAVGLAILALVLAASVLSVIFATRGAIAGNRAIIEVLHFVGADAGFVASQFQRHFLVLALRGALTGGIPAILLFTAFGLWTRLDAASTREGQVNGLLGGVSLSWIGYLGILLVMAAIVSLAAATSRYIVLRQVEALEIYRNPPR